MATIIQFPGPARPLHRTTVRFQAGYRPASRQKTLPLRPTGPTLDQRIAHAKGAAANCHDMVEQAEAELVRLHGQANREHDLRVARQAVAFYGFRAVEWDRKVLDLIAERERATAQTSLFPPLDQPSHP